MGKKILGIALIAAAALMPLVFMALHHTYTEAWGDGYPAGMVFSCLVLMIALGISGAVALGFDPDK